jgi:hypothetical protein
LRRRCIAQTGLKCPRRLSIIGPPSAKVGGALNCRDVGGASLRFRIARCEFFKGTSGIGRAPNGRCDGQAYLFGTFRAATAQLTVPHREIRRGRASGSGRIAFHVAGKSRLHKANSGGDPRTIRRTGSWHDGCKSICGNSIEFFREGSIGKAGVRMVHGYLVFPNARQYRREINP